MLPLAILISMFISPLTADYASCANKTTTLLYKWLCFEYNCGVKLSWLDAAKTCAQNGGRLARLYSREQWALLFSYVETFPRHFTYIGLYEGNNDGIHRYMDGPDFTKDINPMTMERQNIFDLSHRISGSCSSFFTNCHVNCCYYMMRDSTYGYLQVNAWACAVNNGSSCSTKTYASLVECYTCEYETRIRTNGFEKANQPGRVNLSMMEPIETSVQSSVNFCSTQCMKTAFCNSFDYAPLDHLCTLLPATLNYTPSAFLPGGTYSHYDVLP